MRIMAGVAVACALALSSAGAAEGAVVSGEITDPRGDDLHAPDVYPNDLATFGVSYDDAGELSAWYTLHEWHLVGSYPTDEFVSANVGRWDRRRQACDATASGSATFRLEKNHDAPVPWSWITYAVVGHGVFASVPTFPIRLGDIQGGWRFTVFDAGSFAQRGYDCVTDAALTNAALGGDRADVGTFCLGPSGRVPCPPPPSPASPATTPASQQPPPAAVPTAPTPAGGEPTVPRMTRRAASALATRALAESYGRAFAGRERAGFALRCAARGERRFACRAAWRYKRWKYSGTVTITRGATRDATVVKVARRRARAG